LEGATRIEDSPPHKRRIKGQRAKGRGKERGKRKEKRGKRKEEREKRKEKRGKRTPVKFAPLLFFEKFNWARRGKRQVLSGCTLLYL